MAITTLGKLTWSERILEHLQGLALNGLGPMDTWPFAATQDGIAHDLGIARAHVSLEVRKLIARQKVEVVHSHIADLTRRRGCYRPIREDIVGLTYDDGRQYPVVPGEVVRVRVVLMHCAHCGARNRVALR